MRSFSASNCVSGKPEGSVRLEDDSGTVRHDTALKCKINLRPISQKLDVNMNVSCPARTARSGEPLNGAADRVVQIRTHNAPRIWPISLGATMATVKN